MADKTLSMFDVSLYDVGEGYKKDEDWKRYEYATCIASSLESATKIAKNNCSENQIVVSVSERVGVKLFHE